MTSNGIKRGSKVKFAYVTDDRIFTVSQTRGECVYLKKDGTHSICWAIACSNLKLI